MDAQAGFGRIHPAWWTATLIALIATFMWLCSALFAGTLTKSVAITLTSDRAALVMESAAKVKLRGVPVGRVPGDRMGEGTTAANHVLGEINPRMATVQQDWRSLTGATDAYSAAAHNILATIDAFSTTSATITDHAADLDALLLNTIGASQAG